MRNDSYILYKLLRTMGGAESKKGEAQVFKVDEW